MKSMKKGFTLIELMIVVAIIGILAAIAIPKFADLINKSKEGATKGALSSVRSALQVYYGDNEGWFPTLITALTDQAKYINEIPVAKLPGTGHADSATVTYFVSISTEGVLTTPSGPTGAAADTGGWAYLNSPSVPANWGTFVANCTHEDLKGRSSTDITTPWTSF